MGLTLKEYVLVPSSSSSLEDLQVLAADFNPVGDGVADDTAAIQEALDSAGDFLQEQQNKGLSGKTVVRLAGGTYRITAPLIVRNGTALIGETISPPYPNRISGFKSNDNLFTGTEIVCDASFVGEHAIILEADNTNVENLIIDGHLIACGTAWTQINIRTAQNKYQTVGFIKLPVNDPLDIRIQGGLKFDNIEIPYFQVGDYMEFQLQGIGGAGSYSFSITSGQLPDGLSLSSSGLISGTATQLDTRFPTFAVGDGTDTYSRVFTVGTVLDEIKTRDLLPATAGSSYSFFLESRRAISGISWSGVDLPDWLSLNSATGELTAADTTTADDAGFYEFKIKLKDSVGNILDTRAYKLELRYADGSIRIFGEQNLKPQQGVAFSYVYKAHGGYGSYTWSINASRSNGELGNATTVTATSPFSGLILNPATGEISGTATTTGRNTYYLRCTSTVNSAIFFEALFYLNAELAGEQPKIYTRSLATANKGTPYSFQFNVESIPTSEPYTYEAVNLPTGLSMDANGLISGTPTGANFVSGVDLNWSTNVKNCTIRGFRSGGGIYSKGASNVHRISDCLISACDAGIQFVNQTWDSHFYDLYIFNCRVGIDLGAGSAGLTFAEIRVEFIHENGIHLRTAHENDFSAIYFDTCGWSSLRIEESLNALITGCRFFRSGRYVRGVGGKFDSKANRDYSNHIYIRDSKNINITGNIFDIGSENAGAGLYLDDIPRDNLRPYVGIRIHNVQELTVVANNLTGCVNNSIDADLNDFGENSFKGYNIASNAQTDYQLKALPPEKVEQVFYLPNQCFQVWQRDVAFALPAAADNQVDSFEIADGWKVRRGGNSVIDQTINISRGTDAPIGDGFYLHLDKPANTTAAPESNFQTLELENVFGQDLATTSGRAIILSYYARSNSATSLGVKISQYADSADNSFTAYQFQDNNRTLTTRWKRYQHYFELADLSGISLGGNALFNIIFRCDRWDESINLDLTGVQVDFVDQVPFAQELRIGKFEDELAWAQLRYQKSKDYDQYFGSWSDGLRYDVNGANWQPSYIAAYAPTTNGAQLTATVFFENPLLGHPGHPDSSGGSLPNLKILHPQYLTERTNANKYNWSGNNNPPGYIDSASRRGFKLSARSATVAQGEAYACHWIYTLYQQDISAGGGYS